MPKTIKQVNAPKRKRKRGFSSYSSYIYRVLKLLHPNTSISNKAMAIVNSFVSDMTERLGREAGRLARYNKRKTMGSREVQSAVRLVIPGELSRHAIADAHKALTKWVASLDADEATSKAV